MKKNLMKTALALAPAALVMFFTGCTNEELVSEQVRQYEKNFTETFGEIDPTHDWSMATPVTANIDLSNAPKGTYEVKIYSEKNGYLLKKAIVDGSAKLHFDAIKGENSVRILARKTSALGLTPINGYFPVEKGVVNTTTATRASTADNCETTVGEKLDLGSKSTGVQEPKYKAADGNHYNSPVSSLPTDVEGRYYITTIEGADYSEGGNGKYKVKQTKNGQIVDLPDMDMHEVGRIVYPIDNNDWTLGDFLLYNMTSDGQYSIAGGTYVKPACYARIVTTQNVKWAGDFYLLNDVYKSVDQKTQMPFEDLLPLVSSAYENPYFHETDDNRTKWEDDLDFNVELVLTEDGPMTYTYVFYGSIYHNMLGYFYWFETEGMTDAEKKAAKIAAPKYVLMNDTYPTIENPETGGKPNLQCYSDENGTDPHTPDGMQMPTWVDSGIDFHTGHYLQGTTYHMTYFGENYNQPASYTFPKGAHVAFFLITKATANSTNNNGTNQNTKGNGLFYSIQDMNEDQEVFLNSAGEKCILNDKHWWAPQVGDTWDPSQERPNEGEVAAVFYNYKGSMVLGFEDDVDKDENDMLFFVSAPINPPHEITEQTDVEMSWVVACEDLGGSYDYDFNDIVFDLGQVDVTYITTTDEAGTTTSSTSVEKSELYLRPLAAGGTRKAYIYYDKNGDEHFGEEELVGEIHDLLREGAPSNVPINVGGSWDVDPTKVKRIKLADIDLTNYDSSTTPEQYVSNVKAYVAQELQKIKIVVDNEGQKEATEVTAPREDGTNIPQMLLLPRGWDWPNEMVSIFNVYPNFKSWTQDKEKNGWITTPVGSYHTNPIK